MSDISTVWNVTRGDYEILGADLRRGADLQTAVILSLFSDRQALVDDPILDGSGDRRGWWADDPNAGRLIGSRLWLLERAKRTQETLNRAQAYIVEALQWLVDDLVVFRFDIAVEWAAQHTLEANITAMREDGNSQAMRFLWAWDEPATHSPFQWPLGIDATNNSAIPGIAIPGLAIPGVP